jgi:CRISPR-associated protein Cmr1
MFLHGADTERVELRAPPFRGALRYWLRALLGGRYGADLEEVAKAERHVFGSTDVASPVVVRVRGQAQLETGRYYMLPHRVNKSRVLRSGLKPGSEFGLLLQPRLGQGEIPDEVLAAFILLLNFGAIGQRARRGFGSLRLGSVTPSGPPLSALASLPVDGDAMVEQVTKSLKWAMASVDGDAAYRPFDHLPTYPILHPDHTQIVICVMPFDTYEDAMVSFWRQVLRSRDFLQGASPKAFGSSNPRRASSLHMHIAQSKAGYHLVLTAFRAEPSLTGKTGWQVVYDAIVEAGNNWWGEYIYGEEEPW